MPADRARHDWSSAIFAIDSWIERLAALRQKPLVGYAIGAALFCFALLARAGLDSALRPFPFLTFFPAIVLTALLGGVRAASLVTLISGATAWYYFVPPYESWAFKFDQASGLAFFLVVAAIDIWLIDMLQ